MDIEFFREYCLSKPHTSEHMPFDQETLVMKAGGKMFALANIYSFDRLNVKCDPEQALQLRADYEAVQPGFHMNKTHWNTILLDRDMRDEEVLHWIDHSYERILSSLSKKQRMEWGIE